jgi:hypothetical protein
MGSVRAATGAGGSEIPPVCVCSFYQVATERMEISAVPDLDILCLLSEAE